MLSATRGRPSGNRSPFHSGVYLMSNSLVRTPGWANADAESNVERQAASRVVFMVFSSSFEPGRSGHLCFACGFLIHLDADAGALRHGDKSFLNDFAFLDPVPPELGG